MATEGKRDDLEQLVEQIDAQPDPLHADVTPAVHRLVELGLPAAKAVLPLLDAPDRLTRLRAQRVVEGIVMRRFGWRAGRGYADPQRGQQQTEAVLSANGSYDADASPESRRKSIDQWRRWLDAVSESENDQEDLS